MMETAFNMNERVRISRGFLAERAQWSHATEKKTCASVAVEEVDAKSRKGKRALVHAYALSRS